MTYDCFILHDDQTLEPARRLVQYLSRPGGQIGLGNTIKSATSSSARATGGVKGPAAFENDSIIIPFMSTLAPDTSPDPWIDSVLTTVILAAHGRSAREATEGVDTTELTRSVCDSRACG